MIIDDSHWLGQVARSDCSNYNARPGGIEDISLIVVHCISLPEGIYGTDSIERLFANRLDCSSHLDFQDLQGLEVSAHLLIRRSGEIVQFVPFDARAWHAGQSHFQGRDNCNDFSIGIELEGVDDDSFEQVQYQQLCKVCSLLCHCYPSLSEHAITGHSEVALPQGRKTDPGSGFDWHGFRLMLEQA